MLRKHIMLWSLLLSTSILLTLNSCSDGEENEDRQLSELSQLVGSHDYEKYKTYYVTNKKAEYKNESLYFSFDFGEDALVLGNEVIVRADYDLTLKCLANINDLKVGDELQTMLEDMNDIKLSTHYNLSYHYSYINGGKIILKKIDIEKKRIAIEFRNLDVWKTIPTIGGNEKEEKDFLIKSGMIEFEYE